MSPKRPPVPLTPLTPPEWNPENTQTLERRIDLARETEWRHATVAQLKDIAKTLGEVRDLSRTNETTLGTKASDATLAIQAARIDVLVSEVTTLKKIVFYLAPIVLVGEGILLHKGIL